MLASFLLEVPTGAVADRWGRKYALVLAAITMALGSLLYASFPNLYVFAAAEFLFALAFTLASGADQALAYDSLLAEKKAQNSKQVIARLETAKLLGITIGALIGAGLALTGNYRLPMLWQWLPISLAGLLAFSLKEPPQKNELPYHSFIIQGFKYFFGHQLLQALALDLILVGSLTWLMIWLYQALLTLAQVPVPFFGPIHVLIALAQIAVIQASPWLEKKLRKKKKVLLVLALLSGLCFILAGSSQPPLLILAIIGALAFGLAREPLFTHYFQKHLPSAQRATLLSIISMLKTLAIMLINILAGIFVNQQLKATTIGIGIMILIVSGFSFKGQKGQRDRHFQKHRKIKPKAHLNEIKSR